MVPGKRDTETPGNRAGDRLLTRGLGLAGGPFRSLDRLTAARILGLLASTLPTG